MSDSQPNGGAATDPPAFDPAAWQQLATDVDLTPDEIRRRLDHSRTWERRAKDNHDAAQRLPQIEQTLTDATARAETAEQRLAELEPQNLRLRVALDTGLPTELIDRLQGSTEEELRTDATKLLALVVPEGPRPPKPDPSQGGNGGIPAGLNEDRLLADVKSKLGIN